MKMNYFRAIWCCAAMSLAMIASADDVVFKIATLSPDGSSWMKQMRSAGDAIEQRTAGRAKFKFYPGGVQGDDKAVLSRIRIGQLQGGAMTGGAFEAIYPDSQLYNLPLAFMSFDEVDYVRNKLDKTLVAGFESKGFITFGMAEGGLAYIMTKGEAINKPLDLQKHKIWAPPDDQISQTAFATINITAIPLGLGDVLAGLQTNLVDTIASPPGPAILMQWHSQMKSLTAVPLSYIYGILAIDKKAFSKLSAADQAIVRDEMQKSFTALDKQNRLDNLSAMDALSKQGIVVVHPADGDLKAWYQVGEQAQNKLLEKGVISQAMYQQLQSALAEYRKSKAKK